MRMIATLLSVLFISNASARFAGAAPATLPAIPALNADDRRTFVVDGVCRLTAEDGFGFHFATDGTREVCTIFDPHVGTPLYLSDGQQTLVYDLPGNRIVRVPNSRAYVVIDWKAKEPRPLAFNSGITLNKDPKKLAASSFRVDRFVSASAGSLLQLEAAQDTQLFAAQRVDAYIEAIQVPSGKLDWFRFTSSKEGQDFFRLELEARLPRALPDGALRFPDLAGLRRDIDVADLDEQLMPDLVGFLKSGYALTVKMALSGGEEIRKDVEKALSSPDWNELRERDRRLGGAYRTALSRQGLTFRVMTTAPSSQPSR